MRHLLNLIKRELGSAPGQYLWLIIMGMVFLTLLSVFQGQRTVTILLVIGFSFVYMTWGLIHHGRSRTLHLKNVLEYIIIGFTFCFIILLLLGK
ncbi:hypothetical protein M1523_02430 [Patescibacteria group bacterium]|nr:hypothetical protein [Patescibacteria group bacterium]MCL5091422.1 hypothetical protein [Patescibacteria group bacterium]